jgi:chromate transporter
MTQAVPGSPKDRRLAELAALFLKLGLTAFGGPAAHTALMEDEVVRRRRWLTREEFLDLVGATNLIPGPNSTELAIHIGHRRAGGQGLLLAGACFILPAVLIVTAVAWGYVKFGTLPQAAGLLYGVKPVIIAVVLQALWGLGRAALKTRGLAVAGAFAAVAVLLGLHELLVLFGTGLLLGARQVWRQRLSAAGRTPWLTVVPALSLAAAPGAAGAVATPFGLWPMFLFFLKVGSVLFGSGYVLLAFLRADLVDRWQWLTEGQLLDAIAVGQFTPGPLFTTATFIGYLLAGLPGAWLATGGIFLPAFVFVALSGPIVPRLRRSPVAGAFLDGVNAASLALMAVVAGQLAQVALVDWCTILLAGSSGFLLARYRINSAWLVGGGALLGYLIR